MKRREFIKKAGKAAALAAVASEAGLLLNGCQTEFQKASMPKPDFEVALDSNLPKIVLAKNTDHARALRLALDAVGGIERFVKKGEKVLLKPNVAFDRTPEQAVNTNPVVVGEMVRLCREAGAADIIVTDYGTQTSRRTFERSGIRSAVEANGGRVVIVGHFDFWETDLKSRFIYGWPVLKYIFEIDRLINMPIAKHHGMVRGTAAMKNFFGIIGGNRSSLHRQIDQAIVDLAAFFRPTLTVVDATRVLIRNGPQGGSLGDVRIHDSVICATDQVAADARAGEFLGRIGRDIPHVVLAAKQGLGELDYRKIGYVEIE
ncbi:MAG: DUF362 domain-containing protein [Candidatus Zixiibacteriota bacterium]